MQGGPLPYSKVRGGKEAELNVTIGLNNISFTLGLSWLQPCAQSYVAHLLELSESDQARWHSAHLAGDRSRRPGMVRISFGAYNTSDDVDALVEMLERIVRNDHQGLYCQVPESGDYRPAGYEEMVPGDFPPARGNVHGNAALAEERPGAARQTAETLA